MNRTLTTDSELIETLAELEHEQWMHWSRAVAAAVSCATREQWARSWVSYAELPEDVKEADRVWARKVIACLRGKEFVNS
jgi:hypothetical protein